MINNNNIDEIPETIKCINDYFNDILIDFYIVINYSDNTFPNQVSYIQKCFSYGYANNNKCKYIISVEKVRSKDSRYFEYEFKYRNEKEFNSSDLFSYSFTINDIGKPPELDEILKEALLNINTKRNSSWN